MLKMDLQMANKKGQVYLESSEILGRMFVSQNISGPIVMLNLLKFREVADYSAAPHLAPQELISGELAYQLYIEHTLPYLKESGGELIFMGKGGHFLIGPVDERWDAVMLVRQRSVKDFLEFATNQEYLKGIGHRTAALEDSRLLPLVEKDSAVIESRLD